MPGLAYQAIVLAGGDDKRLYPLTTGTVKALLPVANRPLLSYPLKSLADAGLKHVFVVVSGEKPAASIQAWINQEYSGADKMQCEVVTVAEEHGTADALRAVASRITARTCVVMSGDLLADVPVNTLVAGHQLNGSLATVLLFKRKVSPTTQTKPGKAPKNVDYIGLDPSRQHLLFYASSPEAVRDLRVPLPLVRRHGAMTIASDLSDAHLYVFNRSVLSLLHAQPNLSSLRQDLLPFLTQQQLRLRPPQEADAGAAAEAGAAPGSSTGAASGAEGDGEGGSEARFQVSTALPGADYMELSHGEVQGQESTLRVQIVAQGVNYCARVSDVESYGEVCREVADPGVALHLSGLKPGKFDNVVPPSVTIGAKSTIAAGCILGEQCALGDKSSIKRSVLGAGCKLGANVKIINSVLNDNVVVGDGCTIQNTIICAGAVVKERVTLKECQIGPGFSVSAGVEHKGEVLCKSKA
uniref:Translation initiation factor eIF2B subunit gamma n=1 Tax=Chlamydomonas leiostraca TaxID=1034604 RepID=A0A7S0S6S1_9CHLO|mmetsp:Transcript_8440/g.21104  ORF Transcript_8440/g.21104 Transcript_8440/m.21104 type:complete len:469 (+) Transcript_8440:72-1478(+)|eukprot:CAMPEP_0202859810 /NCGR_PEP_ID=MMETSP1391-20130828/1771_1 /ASSEMBLY_ACC=CAM_ASM_000867 /TAXON_ID=1034604 /ORGANISM="Chlamydomonas leiostraca, Strain SAG 11-49" /LENGTH=468 /DNA_ID=CAMNT_0049538895 /DNA_START=72 /DNA_END=1478 /DNA_ORIENTATION=+